MIHKISSCLFEKVCSVSAEDMEFLLRERRWIPWGEFLLNPRRLRGSDFLMRWSQGVWSERRITQALNDTGKFFALPYGPSGTAPEDDFREVELYFERLEKAGLGQVRRPDLLIIPKEEEAGVTKIIDRLGGIKELPFIRESEPEMQKLLKHAVLGVECENSLWKAEKMPDFKATLTPMKRLGGKPGLRKGAVLPTVILKQQDINPLREWQQKQGVSIHIWHLFYDMAFGLGFCKAEELIEEGLIEPTEQTFQAPGGATTKKVIYKFYHHYGYPLGTTQEEPNLVADHIVDKNGHILPYVRFEGGKMLLSEEALEVLGYYLHDRR